MHNRLFFVCPADRLESIINTKFRGVNHYYTSLGDSVIFDHNTVGQIKRLIIKNNIKEIFFVLSNNNPIVLDALGNQEYARITKMTDFYRNLKVDNKYPLVLWHINKNQLSVITPHLSNKIKELEKALSHTFMREIKIEGRIYSGSDFGFYSIKRKDLIWNEEFHLN